MLRNRFLRSLQKANEPTLKNANSRNKGEKETELERRATGRERLGEGMMMTHEALLRGSRNPANIYHGTARAQPFAETHKEDLRSESRDGEPLLPLP